jgi:hypothetical protein
MAQFRQRLALWILGAILIFSAAFTFAAIFLPEFNTSIATVAGIILGNLALIFGMVLGKDIVERAMNGEEADAKQDRSTRTGGSE